MKPKYKVGEEVFFPRGWHVRHGKITEVLREKTPFVKDREDIGYKILEDGSGTLDKELCIREIVVKKTYRKALRALKDMLQKKLSVDIMDLGDLAFRIKEIEEELEKKK